MWSKVLLNVKGLLPPGYSTIGEGFDKVVIEGLGLDRTRVLRFLEDELPTYPRFEAWILAELGGSLPDGAVERINNRILGAVMSEGRRKELLQNAGVEDDGSLSLVVDINELDDLAEFHRYLTEG